MESLVSVCQGLGYIFFRCANQAIGDRVSKAVVEIFAFVWHQLTSIFVDRVPLTPKIENSSITNREIRSIVSTLDYH
jgi:hypothetical protein